MCSSDLPGAQMQHAVAQFSIDTERLPCRLALRQIGFVENNQWRDACMFAGGDAAVDEVVVPARNGGDNNHGLGDIGGDEFLVVRVGAVEDALARRDGFDDAGTATAVAHTDMVTAGDAAAFATCGAVEKHSAGEFNQAAAPVAGDDLTLE